jgi:predicted metalloprotease
MPNLFKRKPALLLLALLAVMCLVGGGVLAVTNGDSDQATTTTTTDTDTGNSAETTTTTSTTRRTTPTTTEGVSADLQRVIDQVSETSEPFNQENLGPDGEAARTAVLDVASTATGQIDYTSTTTYLNNMIQFLDQQQWVPWFAANGFTKEPWVGVQIVQPDAPFTTKCNIGTDAAPVFVATFETPNAFYCPTDPNGTDNGMLILPVNTMQNMWSGIIFNRGQVSDLNKAGDYAAGMLVSHEFGHHVANELAQAWGVLDLKNPWNEQIADCFAGTSMQALFAYGYLEEGDFAEALAALELIGDYNATQQSHGTSGQRQFAFQVGALGAFTADDGQTYGNGVPGDPMNCINLYWQ